MKVSGKTILITGGGYGIGLEFTKLFSRHQNRVIIVGRKPDPIAHAAATTANVTAIPCDITDEAQVKQLVRTIEADFGGLSIVINNAAIGYMYDLATKPGHFEKASAEMLTNYLSVVRLNELLLPTLKKQEEAAIVNISSIVAYAPMLAIPTYSATKAALHIYTQALRVSLAKETRVKVFEVMPPVVNTESSQGIGGAQGVSPVLVAQSLLKGIRNDQYCIRIGRTEDFYAFCKNASEEDAVEKLNEPL